MNSDIKPVQIVTPPLAANVYLILSEVPALIDTGGDAAYLVDEVRRYINPKDIAYIFLTHSHFDHASAVSDWKGWFEDTRVVIHESEMALVRSQVSFFGVKFRPFEPDIVVRGGERFDLGDIELEIIHTPGHSPGSICLYEKEKKWLFSGDTVFAHGSFGRVDLPGGSAYELIESIKKLSNLDVRNLYPGHEDVVIGEGNEHIQRSLRFAKMFL
ncbi:Zn-dependent hydrolase, including glyoxylase [Archaeoglobus sulfaticallidus PM70-1]|uniref:Zn-dependent hydrolase, including glyoxylase n=1 Tax=Archaeoglobus sulfaticallidus PM70-1 TaxID=387631 RepID=N0BIF5_9EURY|nr:MBL fold metallo-hydrolase [Archaeoglobus sulfaticallidus]AGK62077.1 Zn-dependent hydrolase, including glyoxylase [Archaeoglobus sulfaticallidus PM70-1]